MRMYKTMVKRSVRKRTRRPSRRSARRRSRASRSRKKSRLGKRRVSRRRSLRSAARKRRTTRRVSRRMRGGTYIVNDADEKADFIMELQIFDGAWPDGYEYLLINKRDMSYESITPTRVDGDLDDLYDLDGESDSHTLVYGSDLKTTRFDIQNVFSVSASPPVVSAASGRRSPGRAASPPPVGRAAIRSRSRSPGRAASPPVGRAAIDSTDIDASAAFSVLDGCSYFESVGFEGELAYMICHPDDLNDLFSLYSDHRDTNLRRIPGIGKLEMKIDFFPIQKSKGFDLVKDSTIEQMTYVGCDDQTAYHIFTKLKGGMDGRYGLENFHTEFEELFADTTVSFHQRFSEFQRHIRLVVPNHMTQVNLCITARDQPKRFLKVYVTLPGGNEDLMIFNPRSISTTPPQQTELNVLSGCNYQMTFACKTINLENCMQSIETSKLRALGMFEETFKRQQLEAAKAELANNSLMYRLVKEYSELIITKYGRDCPFPFVSALIIYNLREVIRSSRAKGLDTCDPLKYQLYNLRSYVNAKQYMGTRLYDALCECVDETYGRGIYKHLLDTPRGTQIETRSSDVIIEWRWFSKLFLQNTEIASMRKVHIVDQSLFDIIQYRHTVLYHLVYPGISEPLMGLLMDTFYCNDLLSIVGRAL